ncbi:MAG: phage portal protein [Oscillospiraceae bacterium]
MKIIDNAVKGVKKALQKFLEIYPAQNARIVLREGISRENDILRNIVWYRGDALEIEQFFKAVNNDGLSRFWASVPSGEKIRKAHSGLPSVIVDVLSSTVMSDLSKPIIKNEKFMDIWQAMAEGNDWENLVQTAVNDMLITGDGAFKINIDTAISEYPIIEFADASRVEYIRKSGKITNILFYTPYAEGDKSYVLQENYGIGSVTYTLFDDDSVVPLENVQALKELKNVTFEGKYIMAVPVLFRQSKKYQGRGRSIFDGKTDVFDIHDEIISQWLDAIRDGRVQKYVPDDMIPRDAKSGKTLSIDRFGATYTQINVPNMEGVSKKLDFMQPDINYDAFVSSYSSSLDRCLQGIISPATLGIDVSKMTSGEAQREKKDITGISRNAITSVLEKVLPQLVKTALMVYCSMHNEKYEDIEEISFTFGEYASPDFDSRINALVSATNGGIISTQAVVEELWADSKDEKWKEEEIARLLQEKGFIQQNEPSVGDIDL